MSARKSVIMGAMSGLLMAATAVLLISGCGRKGEEKPHQMPQVRPPDISTAIEIPQALYHEMLRYALRYAGSENVGGPFSLRLDKSASKLEVFRENAPGKGYAEWFEYVKPGLYRHFCKFNEEDYSRGLVEMGLNDRLLIIKNRRTGEEIRYAFAEDADVKQIGPAKSFYTVAGGNEPNKTGDLLVNYIKPQGKPEEEDFFAYPAGAVPEVENILYRAKTGNPLEMLTGFYDIKILSYPAIWIKNIAIEEAKTAEIEAGGYGKVLIAGNDAAGSPIKARFFIHAPEDKEKSLATGTTNEPLDMVEGNYYLEVDLNPKITYEDVRIRRNETTKIDLPQAGQLDILAKDFEGKPLRIHYWVYKKGEWNNSVVVGYTSEPVSIQAGEYNIYVNSAPDIKYENVAIKPGEVTELKLREFGALLVRGVDAQGKPLSNNFYLRQPKGKDSVSSGYVNKRLDVPAGVYDLEVRFGLKPSITYEAVKIEPGRVTEINLPR